MASTDAVRIALVFALACCLVLSNGQNRSNQRGTPLITGACLSGDETKICDNINASLRLFVFVVGVEGSGHNMVNSLFKRLSSFAVQSYVPKQHIYEPTLDGPITLYYSIREGTM